MAKDAAISVRIDPDIKAKADALARADRRTLSAWVEALVAREVARKPKKLKLTPAS